MENNIFFGDHSLYPVTRHFAAIQSLELLHLSRVARKLRVSIFFRQLWALFVALVNVLTESL